MMENRSRRHLGAVVPKPTAEGRLAILPFRAEICSCWRETRGVNMVACIYLEPSS